MSITVTREVVEVNVTATRNGQEVKLQPILVKKTTDNNINGGTP